MSADFRETFEALKHTADRLIQEIKRRLFGPDGADGPDAGVRVPSNRNPSGRAGAIALEEPRDDVRVEAVGRRLG